MLVLSRNKDEKIRIGENGEITITVVEIRGNKVRLGIETVDKSVPVHRQEVFEAIKSGSASGKVTSGADFDEKSRVKVPSKTTSAT